MNLIIVFAILFAVWLVGERVVQQRYDELNKKEETNG